MTINVHDTPLIGLGAEAFPWEGTFAEFLESQGIDNWEEKETHPMSVYVNGAVLHPSEWELEKLEKDDVVDVVPFVHGGVFKGIGNIIGSLFKAVFGWLVPGGRSRDAGRSPQRGRELETAQGRANEAKLGDAVPELAGRFKRYPDYLTPPRRYFVNQREQWLEFHACIGPGQYQINGQDVKVGDTPFSGLGGSGSFQIFGPGVNLSGTTTHEHWFTVDEVGGTSSGTAGLELTTDPANRNNVNPASYSFNGNTVTRASGSYPAGWGVGTLVAVYVSRTLTYSVTRIGDNIFNRRNVFSGDFSLLMPLDEMGEITLGPGGTLTGQFFVRELALNSVGVGSLQLWRMQPALNPDDPDVLAPVADLEPGGYPLQMSKSGEYSIASVSEGIMVLNGLNILVPFTGPATVEFRGGSVYGEWTNLYTGSPGNETANTYECDIFAPGGIAYIENNGDLSNRSVGVEFQARNLATNVVFDFRRMYTGRSLDGIGFTERFSLPQGQYAWRVRRTSASSTETNIRDTVHWYGLKSRLPTRTSYPRWTTMSIRLRSGGKIAAQSENQINLVATRILPRLQTDGSWSAPVPTRDISAFAKYITDTIGYTPENWEMSELLRLDSIWKARGETCDHVFDLTTAKKALDVVLGAGMSEFTLSNGAIRPVRDDVRTQFEQGYTPQNMTTTLRRSFTAIKPDTPDGVEVEYTDEQTWTQKTIVCALPGSQRLKLKREKVEGVTNRTRAWRIGMRMQRAYIYRNWSYRFGTELAAMNSEYLSYVPLSENIQEYMQSAYLVAHEPGVLRVSEKIEWHTGGTVVAVRNELGEVLGPWPATPGPDEYTLLAAVPTNLLKIALNQELPYVYIGRTDEWCFPALITKIEPSGERRASVIAVNYAPEVYADDNNPAPN